MEDEPIEKKQALILSKIIKLENIIGILASLFGFNYAYGALRILFGDKYTSDVKIFIFFYLRSYKRLV